MEEQKITSKTILWAYASNAIIPGLCFIISKKRGGLKKFLTYLVLYIIFIKPLSGFEAEYRTQMLGLFTQFLALIAIIHFTVMLSKDNIERKTFGRNVVIGIGLWIVSGFIISAIGIFSGIL